ncbi:MAG: hypothetical protein HYT90_03120 [Candidatus Omnitrophica bacterium]|nr:hypothetical protein [Candidatus Omnitrophota bacterium]
MASRARREEEAVSAGSDTATTSNDARRRQFAQPFGLRRHGARAGVTPPRRIAVPDTPSSSFLGPGPWRTQRGSREVLKPTLSRPGFTLIELALVAVVLIILVAAAAPRLQQTALRLRVEQAASELAQLLRAAHEQAVASGGETVWVWDAAARRARVEEVPEETAPATELFRSSALPEDFSVQLLLDDAPVECSCVRFFPEGTSEPATLTVSFQAHAMTATVDETTGHVGLVPGPAAR